MTIKQLAPELNPNQRKMLLREILACLPEKRRPMYRQGRYLPPNQAGAENTDPEHIKMWKCYNTGFNLSISQSTEAITKLFGDTL